MLYVAKIPRNNQHALCKMLCTYAPNIHQRSTDPVAAKCHVAKNALVKKIPLQKNFPTTHTPLP